MTHITSRLSLIKAYVFQLLPKVEITVDGRKYKSEKSNYTNNAEAKKDRELITLSPVEKEILSVLYPDKELYGLSIINTIEEISEGRRKIGPNTLYPTLRRMESVEKEYITSRWGDERLEELTERGGARRRYYKLTDKGREVLEETWEYEEKLVGIRLSENSITYKPASSTSY